MVWNHGRHHAGIHAANVAGMYAAAACAGGTNTIMAGTNLDSSIAVVVAGAHTADYVGMYPAACAGGGIAIATGTKSASFCRHLCGILYLKYHCKCCRLPAILCWTELVQQLASTVVAFVAGIVLSRGAGTYATICTGSRFLVVPALNQPVLPALV